LRSVFFRSHSCSPERIKVIAAAYEAALQELHLRDKEGPLTEIVAKKILKVAEFEQLQILHLAMQDLRLE